MEIEVKSLEEMPGALSYLIKSVEELKRTVNVLQTKQENSKPKWMDMDELCAYLPSHPAKQTVYGWVSAKQIPVHKINKALAFLQSEIDEWLKSKSCKSENDLMREAEEFINSKKTRVWYGDNRQLSVLVLPQAYPKYGTIASSRYH